MMDKGAVLIIGSGHLANRTKLLAAKHGFTATQFPDLFGDQSVAESSSIREFETIFKDINWRSYAMAYVLFDKDEDNLEVVIAMMALCPEIPIATALFNENIRPHLEKANPNLVILNPAKLAAPFFVKAIDKTVNLHQKTNATKINKLQVPTLRISFLSILISTFILIAFGAISYFHFYDKLSWLDAVYFVVVTIASVGYGDINLLNSSAISKVVGILLILCSTIFIWLIFSLLIDRIIKRRAQRLLGRKKYNYKDHIILCGLGRLGYFIADELYKKGEKVVIVESNQESAYTDYFRNLHVDVYNGNARLPQVLTDAGVENCKALISVINDDYINLEVGLNARYFQPNIKLVLRIFDESMAAVIKDKFDIHLTLSMSFIAAEKFASLPLKENKNINYDYE